MSKNDHEIGYAIINAPGLYVVPGINDSAALLNGMLLVKIVQYLMSF